MGGNETEIGNGILEDPSVRRLTLLMVIVTRTSAPGNLSRWCRSSPTSMLAYRAVLP